MTQVAHSNTVLGESTAGNVKNDYRNLIAGIFGTESCLFVSIHLRAADIASACNNWQRKNGGSLPETFLPFGQEFMNSRRSGITYIDAFESLRVKFLKRLNSGVLGTRFKYGHEQLNCVTAYESPSWRYSNEPVNHAHMLIGIPSARDPAENCSARLEKCIRELFSRLVIPASFQSNEGEVLNIIDGRMTGCDSHPKYMVKQLLDYQTARNRICF